MATKRIPEGTKNMSVNMPKSLYKLLKDIAKDLGMKPSTLARVILADMASNPEGIADIMRRKLDLTAKEAVERVERFQERKKKPRLLSKKKWPGGRVEEEYE